MFYRDTCRLYILLLWIYCSYRPRSPFLEYPLDHPETFTLQDFTNRVADLLGVRREDSGSVNNAVEDELRGDTAGYTDSESHCGVSSRVAVRLES